MSRKSSKNETVGSSIQASLTSVKTRRRAETNDITYVGN